MGSQATLKKISEQLNISISTVSRALKNHPDISENTCRKVKELAALMDYEPNALAVHLRTNKSKVLGLIVPNIFNLFNESFIAAAENEARKNGYSLMILQSGDNSLRELDNIKLCKHYRVDGILISVSHDNVSPDSINRYLQLGIPILFFDRIPDLANIDTVCMADDEVGMLAAETIIKYKKKNILALFGNEALSITKKRKAAFENVFSGTEGDIKLAFHYCNNSLDAEAIVSSAVSHKNRPDHIFCMSDEILIGAMKAIHKTDLSIPDDVSVLAISNGVIPSLFKPEITYIETSGYELGRLAINRMLENLVEKNPPKCIILPSRFVKGGSL